MFDDLPPRVARLAPLSADEADREAARLTDALADIEHRERLINALQAEQAMAVAEYAEGRARMDRTAVWAWDEQSRRICAAELADARRVGLFAAESHMNDALRLLETAPKVFDKLAQGAITLQAARAVADEIGTVRPELQPAVDQILAEEVDQVLPARARQVARTRVMELDPEAAVRAAAHNRGQRYVQVKPSAMVGMATLCAPLPVEQAVACWEALDTHARAARAGGDDRTVSQIMADTLVERVTGLTRCTDVPVEVALVMTDRTFLGCDDRPAAIPGHSPLPASLARSLAVRESTWVRRLLTDPIDDTVTRVETRRRRVDGALRAFVKLRDQHCRGVGCAAKIRDGEHIDDYALGGMTSAGNTDGLCERCHHLEDHDGVVCEAVGCPDPPRLAPEHPPGDDPAGRASKHAAPVLLRWHTPIRRPMVTQAPPALGYGTSTLAQLRNRRHRLRAAKIGSAQAKAAEPAYAEAGLAPTDLAAAELAQSGPVQGERTQAQPVQSEPVQSEPVQSEPVQSEPTRAQPAQSEPVQSEPVQSERTQGRPARSEQLHPGHSQLEVLADAELARVELARIEFAQPVLAAVYVGGHAA